MGGVAERGAPEHQAAALGRECGEVCEREQEERHCGAREHAHFKSPHTHQPCHEARETPHTAEVPQTAVQQHRCVPKSGNTRHQCRERGNQHTYTNTHTENRNICTHSMHVSTSREGNIHTSVYQYQMTYTKISTFIHIH